MINVGSGGSWSKPETMLIKERMIDYEPDLFLVYDGWNDQIGQLYAEDTSLYGNAIAWKNRWIEICNLGKDHGFDVVVSIVVQRIKHCAGPKRGSQAGYGIFQAVNGFIT